MTIEAMKLALEALENKFLFIAGDGEAIDLRANAITALRAAIEQAEKQEPVKLWLWKNFEDGRPEYWAFDNPYPTNLYDGDPQTLGQPCGYAIFKESRDGSCGRTEEQVLREMKNVTPLRNWIGMTDEEYEAIAEQHVTNCYFDTLTYAKTIEAKLKEKNT